MKNTARMADNRRLKIWKLHTGMFPKEPESCLLSLNMSIRKICISLEWPLLFSLSSPFLSLLHKSNCYRGVYTLHIFCKSKGGAFRILGNHFLPETRHINLLKVKKLNKIETTREMLQWLRTHAALAKDLNSVHSTDIRWRTTFCNIPALGNLKPSCGLWWHHAHIYVMSLQAHIHTYM